MDKMDVMDGSFRVTDRDLLFLGGCYVSIGIFLFLFWGALIVVASAAFSDPAGWDQRVEAGMLGASMGITLTTVWGIWHFHKPSVYRWLEEREVPAEEDAGR